MIGDASRVHYLARANVRYSVDLKQAKLSYQDASPSGILTVRVPDVKAEAFIITDTKEKISSLSLLATEGGTGNELELKADAALQRRADADARRPDNLEAARKAALFEIKNLYEDALRATGSPARVNVVMPNARST